MIHSKWLTVEVRGEQCRRMAGRRQVEGHKVRCRIPRGVLAALSSTTPVLHCQPLCGGPK